MSAPDAETERYLRSLGFGEDDFHRIDDGAERAIVAEAMSYRRYLAARQRSEAAAPAAPALPDAAASEERRLLDLKSKALSGGLAEQAAFILARLGVQ